MQSAFFHIPSCVNEVETKTSNIHKLCELDGPADAVGELTWAVFDDLADDAQVKRLEKMIVSSEEARREYLECANIEAHLFAIFADKQDARPSRRNKKTAA